MSHGCWRLLKWNRSSFVRSSRNTHACGSSRSIKQNLVSAMIKPEDQLIVRYPVDIQKPFQKGEGFLLSRWIRECK